jgi:hypothetical protein
MQNSEQIRRNKNNNNNKAKRRPALYVRTNAGKKQADGIRKDVFVSSQITVVFFAFRPRYGKTLQLLESTIRAPSHYTSVAVK